MALGRMMNPSNVEVGTGAVLVPVQCLDGKGREGFLGPKSELSVDPGTRQGRGEYVANILTHRAWKGITGSDQQIHRLGLHGAIDLQIAELTEGKIHDKSGSIGLATSVAITLVIFLMKKQPNLIQLAIVHEGDEEASPSAIIRLAGALHRAEFFPHVGSESPARLLQCARGLLSKPGSQIATADSGDEQCDRRS